MAYEALDNLQQIIDLILQHCDDLFNYNVREIISIRDQSIVLQWNLKHYPNKERIREAASSTHEIIEYLFSEENVSGGYRGFELANRLRESAERLESTVGDVLYYIKGNCSASSLQSTVGDVVDCIKDNSSVSSITDSADVSSSSRSAITSRKDDVVVGFEKDVEVIKDRLLRGQRTLHVIPIVGTGGIGKSTLAKLLYEDASVTKYFNLCAWITISQDHSVQRIVLNLLASIKEISTVTDFESDIPMESLVRKHLELKRYLIVMDDVWNKKAWDDVKVLFPDAGNGSRIIVTTRLQDVATYVDSTSSIHTMSLLDTNYSWNLLKHKVFAGKDFPIELEDIGKKIVQNCGGLPLSIVVLGGLLSKVHTRSSWEQIATNDGQLEAIICSSYNHLPNHLKPCLLYMAGFQEDQKIRVSKLVNLWISEGFVTRSNGSESLEEEAEDCLEDLVERSLVMVTNRKFDGKIKSCSLHDIVREFCVREAAKEKVILSVMDYLPTPILRKHFVPRLIKDHHRISASSYDLHLKDYVYSSRIRTIICIPKKGYGFVGSVEKFSSLKVLHVLRRSDRWDWKPGQVFDLVHLTYLASNIPNSIVPSAISKLQNLQTLIIYRSEVHLPIEIWRLRQLKHLIALSLQPLPNPEGEQNSLDNLEKLSLATDFVCSNRMVEMVPNIKKLGIFCSKEKFDADACNHLNNLKYLCRLLKLEMRGDFSFSEVGLDMSYYTHIDLELDMRGFSFRGLKFPSQLERLTLSGWMLSGGDMTTIGSLPNLRVLKLRNYACRGGYWATIEGEFRELRLLLIDRSNLSYWETEASHFPRLECLILRRHDLYEIPSNIGDIPTLKLIRKKQCDSGNDGFQVRVNRY